MNLAILSQGPNLYSTRRLVEAAQQRGHTVEVINPMHCYMNIASTMPKVHMKDRVLDHFQAVIPRIGSSITFYGTAVLRQFEMARVLPVNSSAAILRSRDKLRSLQVMSRKGIGMPVTGFAKSAQMTEDLISLVGGPPCVIKILESTQGKGVLLVENKKTAKNVIEMLRNLNSNFLVQEFIGESGGSDIRCFVIGDKVVASMRRQGAEGEFRSNLHQGGQAEKIKITPQERALAVKASKAMGLNVSGVDILRSKRGPLILEVNSSPGLEGIEKATGKDIAGLVIEFTEKSLLNPKGSREVIKG
ncbi:MAG: 30S ribosomal protein S6--L-glutamate ligase [Halobacteriovoraceae bacterium]|nr:30S ribosomal protein S6--L-glutamate ligase [Peredibacter sp.]MBJ00269.1 30S ribosomal protein S6--L-glutamate ligase [Halobacteriovoraceae bacterium]